MNTLNTYRRRPWSANMLCFEIELLLIDKRTFSPDLYEYVVESKVVCVNAK